MTEDELRQDVIQRGINWWEFVKTPEYAAWAEAQPATVPKGGYTMNMVQSDQVTAAAVDFTDGSMVCLYPTPEQAQALALPDGQPADTLHVTLALLPEGVEEPEWLAERLAALATWFPPLEGTVGGLGMFAPGDDGVPVIALPDVVGLDDLRVAVMELLAESQVTVADEHGFTPHITLTYGDARMDPPLGFPLTFSSLSLVVGAERWDVPFGAAIVAAYAPGVPVSAPVPAARAWDAAKHPRRPSGSSMGGEWAPKGVNPEIAGEIDTLGPYKKETVAGVSYVRLNDDGTYSIVERSRETPSQKYATFTGTKEEAARQAQDIYDGRKRVAEEFARRDADAAIAEPFNNRGRVTLNVSEVPNAWAVDHGYAEWVDVPQKSSSGYGYYNPTVKDVKSIRWNPGTDAERVLVHYIGGKVPPPDFAPGTPGYEQFSYLGKGGTKGITNKAKREAEVRRIMDLSAALVAAGFVFVEDDFLTAAFDPAAHPHNPAGRRDGGQWARKGFSKGPLYHELDAIAGVELGDVLDSWESMSVEQQQRLRRYLESEMTPGGMLSVEKAREAGHSLGKERADARKILAKLAPAAVTAAFDPSKHARVKAGTKNRKRDPREGGQFAPKDGGNVGKSDDDKPKVDERHPDGTPKGWGLGPNHKMKADQVVGQPGGVPQASAPDLAAREILKGAKDTQQLYKGSGPFGYTTERVATVQNPILEADFAKALPNQPEPTSLFMAGGPGSGKSSVLDTGLTEIPPDAVTINPDLIKERIPEYDEMKKAGSTYAAAGTHEESSDIAKRETRVANSGGYNAVIDGTGDSGIDPKTGNLKFMDKIEAARDAGRKVKVVMVDLPTDESVRRAQERGRKSGRVVPEAEIRAQHQSVAANHLVWRDQVDDWEVWDNDVARGAPPILIARREGGGKIEVLDEARYQQALDKATEVGSKPKRRLRRNR